MRPAGVHRGERARLVDGAAEGFGGPRRHVARGGDREDAERAVRRTPRAEAPRVGATDDEMHRRTSTRYRKLQVRANESCARLTVSSILTCRRTPRRRGARSGFSSRLAASRTISMASFTLVGSLVAPSRVGASRERSRGSVGRAERGQQEEQTGSGGPREEAMRPVPRHGRPQVLLLPRRRGLARGKLQHVQVRPPRVRPRQDRRLPGHRRRGRGGEVLGVLERPREETRHDPVLPCKGTKYIYFRNADWR